MGIIMKNEKRLSEKLERENRYATVFGNFQRTKQADREAKIRWDEYQRKLAED
jgi:hypothetical protein